MKFIDIARKIFGKEDVRVGPLRIKYLYLFGIRFIRRIRVEDYVSSEDLNSLVDIRKVLPARGKLRRLQMIDVRLLRIFDAICQKHGFSYFLYAGTLLGAIRHGGFTPWDDDMDVCVPREQYGRLMKVLEEELAGTNIRLYGIEETRLGDATLRLTHKMLPECNLDVFYGYGHEATQEDRQAVKGAWDKAHENYVKQYKKLGKRGESRDRVSAFVTQSDSFYNDALPERLKLTDSEATFFSSEISWRTFRYLPMSTIYPLSKISFEGYLFSAPQDSDLVLKEFYGDYMSFPPTLAHHGDLFKHFDDSALLSVEKDLDAILARLQGS